MQRFIREVCEKSYANKLDNMEEMDERLRMYNLPRPKEEEIVNLNRQITSKQFNSKQNVPTKRRSDGFMGEFHQIFKHGITLIIFKGFQKIKERILPN